MVAADVGLWTEALPLMTLYDQLYLREMRTIFLEDNQSTLRNIMTGKHVSLRHMSRTHRVNGHWISETCRQQPIDLGACESHLQAADMFTKRFTDGLKWRDVTRLVAIMPWMDFLILFNKGRSTPFPEDLKNKLTETKITKPNQPIRLHIGDPSGHPISAEVFRPPPGLDPPVLEVPVAKARSIKKQRRFGFSKSKLSRRMAPLQELDACARGRKTNRLIWEYCCGDESLMGKPCVEAKGSKVVRLTQREDVHRKWIKLCRGPGECTTPGSCHYYLECYPVHWWEPMAKH